MIRVHDVSKRYRSGRGAVQALAHVSFHLEAGKALVMMGKSGSGKTTLLNCIGGLEKPDKGTITCFGLDLQALPRKQLSRFQRKNIGFVFQFGNLLSYLTVRQNLAFPLFLNGIDGTEQQKRADELLEDVGLTGAGNALPHELSGGELQRIAFARAIAHKPRMLLADEPTASLDSATGLHLVQMMVALGKEQGCTMIIATHDEEIMGLADATMRLRDGFAVSHQI